MAGISRLAHTGLFLLITFIAICEIITSGILVGNYNGDDNGGVSDSVSTRVAFLLFCGLWTFLFSIVFIVGALFAAGNIAFSIVAHLVWLGLTFIFFLSGSAALTSIVRHHHWNHQSRLQILEGFAWTETILVFIAIFFVLAIGTKRGEGIRGGVADA